MYTKNILARTLLSNDIYEKDLEIAALKMEVELLKRSYHQLERFYLSFIERTFKINTLQKGIHHDN